LQVIGSTSGPSTAACAGSRSAAVGAGVARGGADGAGAGDGLGFTVVLLPPVPRLVEFVLTSGNPVELPVARPAPVSLVDDVVFTGRV
jgi:hypothetical protein